MVLVLAPRAPVGGTLRLPANGEVDEPAAGGRAGADTTDDDREEVTVPEEARSAERDDDGNDDSTAFKRRSDAPRPPEIMTNTKMMKATANTNATAPEEPRDRGPRKEPTGPGANRRRGQADPRPAAPQCQ